MSQLHVEVCKIDAINPIPNADRIELATIKGWSCIIQKDSFKVGGVCIFVPPDAVLSDKLIEEQKLTYLKGNRIKTIKLKGVISQGLVLQLSVLKGYTVREGDDVAEILGITKYEPPVKSIGMYTPKSFWKQFCDLWIGFRTGKVSLRRLIFKTIGLIQGALTKKRKANPDFKVYTDIDNIKHYPSIFEEGEEVIITEKIHGTNFRAGYLPIPNTIIGQIKKFFKKNTYEFVYGSHRVQKTPLSGKGFYGEDVYGQIAQRYNLKDIIPPDYTLYGEIYGEKIQELTYGIKGIDVVFFDLKYKDQYLDYETFLDFCLKKNLPVVPVLYQGAFHKDQLKYFTEGLTTMLATHIREGCVVKPLKESYDNHCGRKILKSISEQYLLTRKKENPEEFVDDNMDYAH